MQLFSLIFISRMGSFSPASPRKLVTALSCLQCTMQWIQYTVHSTQYTVQCSINELEDAVSQTGIKMVRDVNDRHLSLFQCSQCMAVSRQVASEAFFCGNCCSVGTVSEIADIDDGVSLAKETLARLLSQRKRRQGRSYKVRQMSLESLSFKRYEQHLDSELWAQIRAHALRRDCSQCCLCGKKDRSVHHTSYSPGAMAGASPDTLVSMCHHCHRHIEYRKGKKLDCEQVFWRLIHALEVKTGIVSTWKRKKRVKSRAASKKKCGRVPF